MAAPKPFEQRKRLRVLQAGAILVAATILVSAPAWQDAGHEYLEMSGLALVVLCITGRLWCILYVGNKKNLELVTRGPYSMTRNPLYFFSTLGAAGIGLMFGSLTVAATLLLSSFWTFSITAEKEASFLREKFGAVYNTYALSTPGFWPNLWLYRESDDTVFSPGALRRTFFDGLYFLAVFPLIELIEHVQRNGYLPTLLRLY